MLWSALTSRIGIALIAALVAAALFGFWRAEVSKRQLTEERLETALNTITDLSLIIQIDEKAGIERADDAQEIDEQRRELNDAANVPGDSADMRELRSLCVVLRQQSPERQLPPACAGLGQ